MTIQVLFFGATVNAAGERKIELFLPEGETSDRAFEQIKLDYPKLRSHKLLYALNQNYTTGDEVLRDGDELAIFTAVSGG